MKYSKAIGATVASGVAVAVAWGFMTPEEGQTANNGLVALLTAFAAVAGVWVAPANRGDDNAISRGQRG